VLKMSASGGIMERESPRVVATTGGMAEPARGSDMAKATCSVAGCDRPARSKTLCHLHYERVRRLGSVADPRPTVTQRFWNQVLKLPNGCWVWQGYTPRAPNNYGRFRVDATTFKTVHRFSWELANGPVPDGLYVLHHCDNPPCVNPAHLYVGTQQDNVSDRERRGRGRYAKR
jgi:hypothetical protein